MNTCKMNECIICFQARHPFCTENFCNEPWGDIKHQTIFEFDLLNNPYRTDTNNNNNNNTVSYLKYKKHL